MIKLNEDGSVPADLHNEIRKRFFHVESDPISGERIYFEAASGSLRLKTVVRAIAKQSEIPDQIGRANATSYRSGELLHRGIEDVRLFLGAKSGVIMPAMSSTHAIFRVVNAVLARARRTNVVTTDLEHPSVYDSTFQISRTLGMQWRVAHLDPESGRVNPESILKLIDEQTSLLALIHCSNVTGAILDIKKIVSEARRINPDVYILVDGVQYAPHAPIDVDELGIDAYVFGPYKVYCVKGIGYAYLSDRLASLRHWALKGKPANDWVLGSPEEATYAAWSAVVDYVCWLGSHFTDSEKRRDQIAAGMQACYSHEKALLNRLAYGNGSAPGLFDMEHIRPIGVSEDLAGRACLLLFNALGIPSSKAVELYRRNGIRVHERIRDAYTVHTLDALKVDAGVRLSACHYNSFEEIDRFLTMTEAFAHLSEEEIDASQIALGPAKFGEG